jgi:hypothetical protein
MPTIRRLDEENLAGQIHSRQVPAAHTGRMLKRVVLK